MGLASVTAADVSSRQRVLARRERDSTHSFSAGSAAAATTTIDLESLTGPSLFCAPAARTFRPAK
jgi:hypothetical protein